MILRCLQLTSRPLAVPRWGTGRRAWRVGRRIDHEGCVAIAPSTSIEVRPNRAQQVAIEIDLRDTTLDRSSLLLARNAEPTGCLEDPMLGGERYIYVEGSADAAARGSRGASRADATGTGSVTPTAPPELVSAMAGWFIAPVAVLSA